MPFENASIIIVKIGSSLLVDRASRTVNTEWLDTLCADVDALIRKGKQVVIVSSGAVALGRDTLGAKKGALSLREKQAAAACGQIMLMKAYREGFSTLKRPVAQVLLGVEDSDDRTRYLNARATLRTLIECGVIPIINENDTVATEELRFGDNDRLAARVAQMVEADCLVLLSDIDGLYDKDPRTAKDARHIPLVEEITEDIEEMGGKSLSEIGSGGMRTKIMAARIATAVGCHTYIARGDRLHPLQALTDGALRTQFLAKQTPYNAREVWIAHQMASAGIVQIDAGAVNALKRGSSLLPAGVIHVSGDFHKGDAVRILGPDKEELGRGIVGYSSEEAERIIGAHTRDLSRILGYEGRHTIIHHDDMVLFWSTEKPEGMAS